MPSPFPGMNPYLERSGVWEMFHTQLLSALQQHLAAQVRPKYRVRMETRVYVHDASTPDRFVGEPDLGIVRPPSRGTTTATVAPAYATLSPWIEIENSRFLEIRDRFGDQVVTVLELLSPSNKYAGPDREQYLVKRNELLISRAHFVELDLLRGGPRLPLGGRPPGKYFAVVSRMPERPRAGVWAWNLRDPIPPIPVPLGEGDPDARMDLKAVLDHVYDAGVYEEAIYDRPPEPQLNAADAAWAAQFVPAPPAPPPEAPA